MLHKKNSTNKAVAPLGLLFFFLLAGAQPALTQDLHMYYDLFSDSISYRKNGELVAKPKIRKGDFIILHFTEYNPYLYQVEVDIEQTNSDEWAGGASSGSLNLATSTNSFSPFGMGGGGSSGLFSFMDMPLLQLGQSSLSLKDFFANSRGPDQLLSQAQTQLQALTQTQAAMAGICAEIQAMEKSERVARMAPQHLDLLMHNPRLRPSVIRGLAEEYREAVFPGQAVENLGLEGAFTWEERPAVKRRLLNDLQARQSEFDAQMRELSPIAQQLGMLDAGSPALEQFSADLLEVTRKSGATSEQLKAYIAQQNDSAGDPPVTLDEIMALQLTFRELAEQSFSYDVAISVEKNNIIVTGHFSPHDSLVEDARGKRLSNKVKTVKIQSSGGLRITTGFGVAFGRLFNPAEEFNAREQVIVADEGGVVQPSLSTFIHFYPNQKSGVALAGTFGIGIPISNSGLSAINFYLGPSLLFGRGQRIVLSAGLSAGPAKRLAKGFKVGDFFDPDLGDIPTQTRYELGYFVGISFNMGG